VSFVPFRGKNKSASNQIPLLVSLVFSASTAGDPSASVGTDIVVADNEQNPALSQRLAFVHPVSLKLPSSSRTDLSRDYAGQDGGQVRSKVQPQISQINTPDYDIRGQAG